MPRKPILSPTKLTTYLACPTKYMWTYVDPRGRMYMRAKSYYSFGTTLHNVLQRFHDSGDAGVTTKAEVVAAYEESWIDAGYSSAEEMSDAIGEGREILERYVEEAISAPSEAKTLFVEKQLRKDMGNFVLLGRIDRVDEYPDARLEIVDYKSGRSGVSSEDVASDLALGIYQILLREQYSDRNICATIVALRVSQSATASLTEQEIEELKADILDLGDTILNTNWDEHEVVKKPLCTHCDFLKLCSKVPGFND